MANYSITASSNVYAKFVHARTKSGVDIQGDITPFKLELLHAAIGVSTEAGELADVIKKHCIYTKPLDVINVIEELGDVMFYMQAIKNSLALEDEDIIKANMEKLSKRYPKGYTNYHAQARLDKK